MDAVTDGILLFTVASDPSFWFLTCTLVISISSPYIISYSSGVQMFLFRQTFDDMKSIKKILMMIFLLPTSILYFIFLHLTDAFSALYRLVQFLLCCENLQEISQTEQALSKFLGMDRMHWEGFKRQRIVAQFLFESLPQFFFQLYLFWELRAANISGQTLLTLSIVSAGINILSTLLLLDIEARSSKITIIAYVFICINARAGWFPQRERILDAATMQYGRDCPETVIIDYRMEYRPWFFPPYKHSVEYDFSPTTIRYLMSALQMLNASKEGKKAPLQLVFRNSLRLLPLQHLIDLFTLCQEKQIKIDSIRGGNKKYKFNWQSAFQVEYAVLSSVSGPYLGEFEGPQLRFLKTDNPLWHMK